MSLTAVKAGVNKLVDGDIDAFDDKELNLAIGYLEGQDKVMVSEGELYRI